MTVQWQEVEVEAKAATDVNNYELGREKYIALLALTEANKEDEAVREARLNGLAELGRLVRILGAIDEAKGYYEQYYLEAGNSQHAVRALNLLGAYHSFVGDNQKGLGLHQEALYLAEGLNYTRGRAEALRGIGKIRHHLGQSEEALSALKKALAVFEQLDDAQGRINTYFSIGHTLFSAGRLDQSIETMQAILELAHETNSQNSIVIALNNLGECHQLLFNMEQALICHEEGLAAAELMGIEQIQADLRRNIGVDKLFLGEIDEGMALLREALQVAERLQDRDMTLQCLYSLALGEIEHGEAEAGKLFAERLQQIANESQAQGYLAMAWHALGHYYRQVGDNSQAEQAWQQAIFVAHEAERRQLLWQIHADLAELTSNEALAMAHRRIAAEVIEQIAYPMTDSILKKKYLASAPVKAILDSVS
ncbi:MAG TPA: tetratricopeptide repeat protein [Anaerolineae bacterium]|nr:tetratricopeptide repeat protein [Anaerolineae bacterium]